VTAPGKQERTYAILRSRILDGTYGPGQRLVIDALARDLAVSPMPVREAIRRLEARAGSSTSATRARRSRRSTRPAGWRR
jgi:DNA-binding FadR family transcriptional regulator